MFSPTYLVSQRLSFGQIQFEKNSFYNQKRFCIIPFYAYKSFFVRSTLRLEEPLKDYISR